MPLDFTPQITSIKESHNPNWKRDRFLSAVQTRRFLRPPPPISRITIRELKELVAEEFPPETIKRRVAIEQITAWIAFEKLGKTFSDIGRFSRKHHTTARYSHHKIETERLTNPLLQELIDGLVDKLPERSIVQ